MLRNKELSLKAKGLLAQLLSHTETWKITIKSLCIYNKEGRKAIESAIKELIAVGYMIQEKCRDEGGKFDVEYYVSDRKSDLTDVPFPPRQDQRGEPDAEKGQRSYHINKNINQEDQKRILSSLEQLYEGFLAAGVRLSYVKKFFECIDDDDFEFVCERLKEMLEKSKDAHKRAAYLATSIGNLKKEMESEDYKKQKEESRKKEEKKKRRGEEEKRREEMMKKGMEIYKEMEEGEREITFEEIFRELDEAEKKRIEIFGNDVETLPITLRNTIYVKMFEKFGKEKLEGLEG